MINANSSAVLDNSFLQRIVSHKPSEAPERFLQELLDRYRIIIPFVLIEEILINLARPGGEGRARVARTMATLVAECSANWIDEDMRIIFRELVLREPILRFPPLSEELAGRVKEIFRSVVVEGVGCPELGAFVSELGERRYNAVMDKAAFQNALIPYGSETCFKTFAAFMTKEIYPFFRAKLKDPLAKRRMLEAYFGRCLRLPGHPDMKVEIDEAFEAYGPDTLRAFPVTTNWLIVHLTYMRAPLAKIGPEVEKKSLPCLIHRGKHQVNDDFDERYVIAGMMCDRILTCDGGMKNIGEALREGGYWPGQVRLFPSRG